MKYRQYGENTAKVLPPFSAEQILTATKRVVAHYRVVLDNIATLKGAKRKKIEERLAQTNNFLTRISTDHQLLVTYVEMINQYPMEKYWWAYVAHPALEELWKN